MGYVREEREEFLLVLNSVTSTPQWIRPEPRDMRKNTTAQVYSRVLPETLFCSMNPNSLSLSLSRCVSPLALGLHFWVPFHGGGVYHGQRRSRAYSSYLYLPFPCTLVLSLCWSTASHASTDGQIHSSHLSLLPWLHTSPFCMLPKKLSLFLSLSLSLSLP